MSQNLTLAALGHDGILDKLLQKALCRAGNPDSPNRVILGASYLTKERSAFEDVESVLTFRFGHCLHWNGLHVEQTLPVSIPFAFPLAEAIMIKMATIIS